MPSVGKRIRKEKFSHECKIFGKQLDKILKDLKSDSEHLLPGIYL